MLKDNQIRGLSQREYSYDELIQEIKRLDKLDAEFFIGTDSQVIKKKISIVTCVCAILPGENRVFYVKQKISKTDLKNMSMPEFIIEKTRDNSALRLRMLLEAYRSIEAAMEVEPYIKGKLNVHLDVGSDSKVSKSAIAQKELQYLVQSQGYECAVKPDAWAASAVADRVAKS
jgi:predicted RNase H-related nuclease YkuK (DUF458 family)